MKPDKEPLAALIYRLPIPSLGFVFRVSFTESLGFGFT